MRLTKIRVQNHSRLEDLDIEVRNHLVLVGANDVGKSSLLRCLDLVFGSSTAQLYAQITSDDFRDKDQPFIIEVDLDGFSDDDRALYPDEINVDSVTSELSMTIQLTATVDESETLSIDRRAPGSGTTRQLSRDQLLGLGWKFLSATSQTRDLRDDRKSALNEILKAVDLGSEKATFDAITESLGTKLGESIVLGEIRSGLADQLSKALPDPISNDDLSFVPGATADDDVLSDVRLRVSKNGVPHNVAEQSDGTRALYAIALYDLMSVGANVVGIDEPEVHLHPTSQRSLARLLKSNPNQKVIATHSADIVGAFEPDSIVVVRAGGRLVQPSAGFLSADERMMVRWWVRDRLEPLTSRRVVAVEGPSDRLIVEKAAELTDRSLDRLGISIVETGGSGDMAAIETLFGPTGFGVPLTQLIDEDAEQHAADRLGIAVEDLPSSSIWVSTKDLEDEYARAIGGETLWQALSASPMFGSGEMANCSQSGPSGTHTDEEVAAFCRRKKYKMKAAMVASRMLDATQARAITSVENLLSEVVAP
jgi:putative ATP-dependent endonuclease of OLD family